MGRVGKLDGASQHPTASARTDNVQLVEMAARLHARSRAATALLSRASRAGGAEPSLVSVEFVVNRYSTVAAHATG